MQSNDEWNQAVMEHIEADINQIEHQLGMMRSRLRQFQNVNKIGPGVPASEPPEPVQPSREGRTDGE